VFPADADAIAAFHRVRIQQPALARHAHHLAVVQALEITGVDVGDVGLAMHHQFLPVQRRSRRYIEAHRRSQADPPGKVGRQPHRLLRHAADVDAGTAQFARFQHRHPLAVLRCAEGGGQATGATAQHDQIVVVMRWHGRQHATPRRESNVTTRPESFHRRNAGQRP